MCFIKRQAANIKPLFYPQLQSFQSSTEVDKTPLQMMQCSELLQIFYPKSPYQLCTSSFTLLPQLLSKLAVNSDLIMKLQTKIDDSNLMLDEAFEEAKQYNAEILSNEHTANAGWMTKEKVIEKLFGPKEYKYRLKLKHRCPTTIYKGRKLALGVQLVNCKEERVLNSNLVNICIAACEVDGKWIQGNEKGESFIQGKAEEDMYHGEALFMKIYPRDVSRKFRNGKISLIVYPKTSLIEFTTSASNMEEIIDADEIEPLIAKDITIRAKKKSNQ